MNIGINEQKAQNISTDLQAILSKENDLFNLTRLAHWNVTSPLFASLHKLFEKQYEQLVDIMDDVAERIRQMDNKVTLPASMPAALESDPNTMVATLLKANERIITDIRENITVPYMDAGTINFLTDLMQKHEKTAWMLRSSLTSANQL